MCSTAAAGEARQLAEPYLRADISAVSRHEALLVISELVANAVEHGEPPVRFVLCPTDTGVLVRVDDQSTARPEVQAASENPLEIGGRGLAIVDALARTWGVEIGDSSKSVWAEIVD